MNIKRIRWVANSYFFSCRMGQGYVSHNDTGWYWNAYRRGNEISHNMFDIGKGGPLKSVLEAKKEAEKFMRWDSNDMS